MYLRLDRRGLSVVHTAEPGCFGPYLGGLKVRLAVSGLNRVLPLPYAQDRLRGSALEMARLRGVDPGERESLVRQITAVLRREPDAVAWVAAELAGRRNRAAEDLAFELAAKVQQEIEAIGWVVSPQHVSLMDNIDADRDGWPMGYWCVPRSAPGRCADSR